VRLFATLMVVVGHGLSPAGSLAVGPLLSFWAGMAALRLAGRVGGRETVPGRR
jgi:hypothetical protein